MYAKPGLETQKQNAALQERKALKGKSQQITEVGKVDSKEEKIDEYVVSDLLDVRCY